MCYSSRNLEICAGEFYGYEPPGCEDCRDLKERLNEVKECMKEILHHLQSEEPIDILSLDNVLSYACDKIDINMSTKPLNIERPSQSIRMLNEYLSKVK